MANKDGRIVALVGAFKLVKASILITLGIVAMGVAPEHVANWAEHTVAATAIYPGGQTVREAIEKLWALDRNSEKKLGVLALAYATVFVIEGVGLLARRKWAEWMTVAVTTSFIPFEVYETVKEVTVGKIGTLIVNVAIVLYLLQRRLAERRKDASRSKPTPKVA